VSEARVCIHAHFYQPPRDNPWLEEVEPEPSASPYHDWTARITAECYAPNGAARQLDAEGRIVGVRNNYASISFNFGPTLLGWLERMAPTAYAAILEADARSAERFGGHGSALAQPYNHMIMPLASSRDRRTQILWGLADFRRRFRRDPEGAWLPETAVDLDTLEDLASHGIRFTVLAPHQALRVRTPEGGWREVAEGGIDTTVAYRQVLPSGREIALFFYDGPTSRAVAFESLLDDGELFADRLIGLARETAGGDRLVHIATDGETYGHHHAHGDMALAVALGRLESEPGVKLANYASFLADCSPRHEVEIREGTSWSCAHGIERWRSDCGCSTGGEATWSQAWREPLRDALDGLSEDLARVFEEKAAGILPNAWAARDEYIEVVHDWSAGRDAWLDTWCPGAGEEKRRLALRLLEMQRCAMLMFTSCGWFFNDLAGIETRQILRYAARALDLAESVGAGAVRAPFEAKLREAKANGDPAVDGREVLTEVSRAARISAVDVAADRAARLLVGVPPADYSAWEVDGRWATASAAPVNALAGEVTVRDLRTDDSRRIRCRALTRGRGDLTIELRPGEISGERPIELDLGELRPDARTAVEHAWDDPGPTGPRLASTVAALRAAIADLVPLPPGAQRESALRRLETLLARVGDPSVLPLWELQSEWWQATEGWVGARGETEERVARLLGFAVDRGAPRES